MPELKEDIYLVAALRTPIGKFGGALASLTAAQLGAESAKATVQRSGIDPTAIDEVIFGNARQAGVGPNVARQIAVRSGLRHEVPAYTVNFPSDAPARGSPPRFCMRCTRATGRWVWRRSASAAGWACR